MKPILTVQYLRAVAAILVVIYHHNNAIRESFGPVMPGFHVGAFGVDIFFVISGFIMWTISTARPTKPGGFMKRRIIRIAPVYWVFTLIAAFISTDGGLRIGFDPEIGTFLNSLFFIPDWNPKYPEMVAPILVVGWTLNLEMMFYVLFSGALFLPQRLRLGALLAVLAVMGTARLWIDYAGNPAISLYSQSIVLEFGFGVLLGCAYMNGLERRIGGRHGWKIALALFSAALAALVMREAMTESRALHWGVPALLIVAGGLFLEPYARSRPSRSLKFLGDASYSIYLSHLMALALSQKFIGAALGASAPYLALALETLFAIAFGALAYLLIERPATEAARRLWAGDLKGALEAATGFNTLSRTAARLGFMGKTARPARADSQVTVSGETE